MQQNTQTNPHQHPTLDWLPRSNASTLSQAKLHLAMQNLYTPPVNSLQFYQQLLKGQKTAIPSGKFEEHVQPKLQSYKIDGSLLHDEIYKHEALAEFLPDCKADGHSFWAIQFAEFRSRGQFSRRFKEVQAICDGLRDEASQTHTAVQPNSLDPLQQHLQSVEKRIQLEKKPDTNKMEQILLEKVNRRQNAIFARKRAQEGSQEHLKQVDEVLKAQTQLFGAIKTCFATNQRAECDYFVRGIQIKEYKLVFTCFIQVDTCFYRPKTKLIKHWCAYLSWSQIRDFATIRRKTVTHQIVFEIDLNCNAAYGDYGQSQQPLTRDQLTEIETVSPIQFCEYDLWLFQSWKERCDLREGLDQDQVSTEVNFFCPKCKHTATFVNCVSVKNCGCFVCGGCAAKVEDCPICVGKVKPGSPLKLSVYEEEKGDRSAEQPIHSGQIHSGQIHSGQIHSGQPTQRNYRPASDRTHISEGGNQMQGRDLVQFGGEKQFPSGMGPNGGAPQKATGSLEPHPPSYLNRSVDYTTGQECHKMRSSNHAASDKAMQELNISQIFDQMSIEQKRNSDATGDDGVKGSSALSQGFCESRDRRNCAIKNRSAPRNNPPTVQGDGARPRNDELIDRLASVRLGKRNSSERRLVNAESRADYLKGEKRPAELNLIGPEHELGVQGPNLGGEQTGIDCLSLSDSGQKQRIKLDRDAMGQGGDLWSHNAHDEDDFIMAEECEGGREAGWGVAGQAEQKKVSIADHAQKDDQSVQMEITEPCGFGQKTSEPFKQVQGGYDERDDADNVFMQ